MEALVGEYLGHELAGLRFLHGQQTVGSLDDRHLGAEAGEYLSELDADGAPAEHHQGCGKGLGLDGVAVGPVLAIELGQPGDGRCPRLRPGGYDHGPARLVGVVTDHHAPRAVELPPAAHEAPALAQKTVHGHLCRSSRRWPRPGCVGPRVPSRA